MSSPDDGTSHLQPSPEDGDSNDDEDVWSGEDPAEEDSRKRKRAKTAGARPMSVSCELCKQRKVKCDRGQPHCGWCVRNGQVCEYKERKKPGLRAGYGRELESRLDKLEGVLQAQQTLLQQLAQYLPNVQQGPNDLTSPAAQLQQEAQQAALFAQTPTSYPRATIAGPQQDGNQLRSQQQNGYFGPAPEGALGLHADIPPVGDISKGYTASHPPLESPSLDISNDSRISISGQSGRLDTLSQDQDFPPYDLLYALTDLFFKHINTWSPILHRRTTLDALFGPSILDEDDRVLLHAIVATTLRFSTDTRLTDQIRERYYSTSKQKVLLYGLEHSSVKVLQALVILALDIVGSSNGPPGWNLLALITRSVVQLGLAVETTSSSVAPLYPSIYTLRAMVLPESKTFIEDESRRRLFWMTYLLDRYATIATAFEFALDEKEIDRKLPCRDDLFSRNQYVDTRWVRSVGDSDYIVDKPENLGSFSYYIEIVCILSQIHQFLKRPVDISALADVEQWQHQYRQLDAKLNAWKFSLPSEYGNTNRLFIPGDGNKIVTCIWIMLHVTYHTTIIRLHSSAAYPTTRSPIFTPSFAASQRCLTAVEDICALCSYVRKNNMLDKLGPPFAFSLWVAARLLLVHGSTIDHQVNPAIGLLVETLRELGAYWKVAQRYATLLQRVMDEYYESEQAPVGANGVRETPSTVRILADMRRCAYDLDFLISHQPRQHFGANNNTNSSNNNNKSGPAITPARTPAPNELEYLDVFDFFNMPRLMSGAQGGGGAAVDGTLQNGADHFGQSVGAGGPGSNEFNITNFMYDANADWLGSSTDN